MARAGLGDGGRGAEALGPNMGISPHRNVNGPGGNGWPINGCGLEIESESDRKGGGVESDP